MSVNATVEHRTGLSRDRMVVVVSIRGMSGMVLSATRFGAIIRL
jgi:hypothetical protein